MNSVIMKPVICIRLKTMPKIRLRPKEFVAYYLKAFPAALLFLLFINFSHADTAINNTIGIEVTTHLGDKQTFQKGDVISFLISLDRDAYVLMIYEDAEHNLLQIIPNRYRQINRYDTGLFISVSNRDEPFEFVVSPPFGKETVWVFASEQSFEELQGMELENGLKKLSASLPDILAKIRANQSKHLYGEASTTISTAAK
jgi:hypothetical protein